MTNEKASELVKAAFDAWKYLHHNIFFLTGDDWNEKHEAKDIAIKALEQKSETVTEFADRCRECGTRYGKALERTRWILVSERLPKDGTYLVTKKTHEQLVIDIVSYAKDLYTIDKFDFVDEKGKGGWYGYDSEFGYYEVTESIIAWQELPRPYKSESEDKK